MFYVHDFLGKLLIKTMI